jgi:tRNA-modifying protein YgfZ
MQTQPINPADDVKPGTLEDIRYFEVFESGVLRLGGDDRLKFIQRQSTNDVLQISPQNAIHTVLTSPTGRILDVLQIFALEDEILAITLPSIHLSTLKFLRSRIFFMDKVEISDVSPQFSQYFIIGEQATEVIARLGATEANAHNVVRLSVEESELYSIIQAGKLGTGIRLLVPKDRAIAVKNILDRMGIKQLSPDEMNIYRIEEGIPAPGAELTENYTPLEVGLAGFVAENKGCYTGQEVLARQLTYQKITRQMVGLRLADEIETGSRLYSEAEPAGELTSSAVSPRHGPIGLAVVKTAFIQPGQKLSVRAQNRETMGVVQALPFTG